MTYYKIDLSDFIEDDVFREDVFKRGVDACDWSEFKGKRVLVRGCDSAILPPWAFMYLTAKLTPFARAIHFGNEHDNVVVFRDKQ